MPDTRSVGAASNHGRVYAGGDIVGRDKVVNVALPGAERSIQTYVDWVVGSWDRVPKPVLTCRGRERPHIAEVYVDALTDALRAGNKDGAEGESTPRFSAVEAQMEIRRLVLCGPRNSGKSSAMRAFASLAGLPDASPPRLVPVVMEADDSFGRWLGDTAEPTVSDLAGFVGAEWGFDLMDLRTIEREAVFLWDHTYLLPTSDRRKVVSLIAGLQRWVPRSRHVVAARSVALEGFDLPDDFQVVRLLPLGTNEVAVYTSRYVAIGAQLAPREAGSERGDLLRVNHPGIVDDFTTEYTRRLMAIGNDPEPSAVVAGALPEAFWRLLLSHPVSLSFFRLLETVTAGDRALIPEATALLDALVDDRLLATDGGCLLVADHHAVREAAVSALAEPRILQQTIAAAQDAPLMYELLERSTPLVDATTLRRITASSLSVLDPSTTSPPDLRAATILRLALKAAEAPGDHDDGLPEAIAGLAEVLTRALDDGWPLPVLDELRRLVARAHLVLERPLVMTFRRANPSRSRISLPSGSGHARVESTVVLEYPVWFAVEPITNEQLAAIARRPEVAAVLDHVLPARPEAWASPPNREPAIDSRQEPAVGIDLDDALAIAASLTHLVSVQISNALEVRVPTLAEWGLLDTGLATGCAVNLPKRVGSLRRPVTCGVSGRTSEDFSDVYGNVMEWTATSWGSDALDAPEHTGPYEPNGPWDDHSAPGLRVLRGGSWLFDEAGPRCACLLPRGARFPDVGFRPCVRPTDIRHLPAELPESFQVRLQEGR